MSITIEFAEEKRETLNDRGLENKLDIILKSINDWPVEVNTFEEYCEKVELFLGQIATKKNIDLTLRSISMKNNAWEAESLTQLISIFDFYQEDARFEDIIARLKIELIL